MVQMILLQLFVYSYLATGWYTQQLTWIHLGFIFMSAIVLEVLRKIKITNEESVGHDTYSWHTGFKGSVGIFSLTVALNYLLFLWLLYRAATLSYISFGFSVFFMVPLVVAIVFHYRRQTKWSEKIVSLETVLWYIGLNLIIYFLV